MGKIIVIKWVKELGFNCLMGVINIVSGRFFSFFSMTRFLACANVLRLDEYDFLYLPLCKRKLDFSKRRQDNWTFNQKFPKMAKNGQKWPKMAKNGQKWPKMTKNDQKWPKMAKNGQKWPKITKHVLRLQTKFRLYKYLNVLDTVNISKSESIASTLAITLSKKTKNCPKKQNITKNYQRWPKITKITKSVLWLDKYGFLNLPHWKRFLIIF